MTNDEADARAYMLADAYATMSELLALVRDWDDLVSEVAHG